MKRPDAFEELRGENPVPGQLPAPAIEPLLRRLDQEPHSPTGPSRLDRLHRARPSSRWRRVRDWSKVDLSALPIGGAVLVTIGVVVVALIVVKHHPPQPSTARPAVSSRQQLINILAVLRRPQTKADLAGVRDLPFFRNQGRRLGPALAGTPDWPLVRLAAVTPWGDRLFFVPMKPPTAKSIASASHRFPQLSRLISQLGSGSISQILAQSAAKGETLYVLGSDGGEGEASAALTSALTSVAAGPASAANIEANGAGSTGGRGPAVAGRPGSSYTRLIRVVPDSVAKVAFLLPRESPAVEPGAPISKHSLTVTVAVHDNVAAVQVDRTKCCGQVPMTWYDAAGDVIKRIGKTMHREPPLIHTVPVDLQRAFAVFRRPRTAADELPGGLRGADAGYGGVNPGLSRLVIATPTVKLWIEPGQHSSCLVVKGGGGGGGCAPNNVAEVRGLVGGIVGTGLRNMWFGALPEGAGNVKVVQKDGQSTPVTVNLNGGFVQPVNQESLSFTNTNGTVITIPSGAPTVPRKPR